MATRDFVALIHVAGFLTGVALYGMLAVMTWRRPRAEGVVDGASHIPLLAAVLGLIWNAGALVVFGWQDYGLGELSPWFTTISYAALGFLPAVVVDSATRTPQRGARPTPLALAAYLLSAAGAAIQARATTGDATPVNGFTVLTLGYGVILLWLALTSRRRTGSQRVITVVALAAFAASAFHLSRHASGNDSSWIVELIGHHASLPLVLVILYQDYRFALADLFLKRAIAVLTLAVMVVAAYALLVPPLATESGALPIGMPSVLLAAWVGTALLYPALRRAVDRFVDRVILGRVDYRELRSAIAASLADAESPDAVLDRVSERLREALTAARVVWREEDGPRAGEPSALVTLDGAAAARVAIPTADAPTFTIDIGGLAEGRRLLSDDVALLESVALVAARRIDELRVARERLERDVREYEMQRLAAEAELRALRAQLNPHFLFNALTTIGFLVRTSPPRALDTLYQLTALLRAVLRRATGEFVTLTDEMQIVDAYLAIEKVRFEDRLQLERDVPAELGDLLIPPLVLQPIVENAIKHGIATRARGGFVRIEAAMEWGGVPGREGMLRLRVADTGPGVPADELARRRAVGVGLSNIERRLQRYFGARGRLAITSEPGRGTTVELFLPVVAGASKSGGIGAGAGAGAVA